MVGDIARSRVLLPGISSRTWEHPADRGALVALRRLKGFDSVVKALSGLVNERAVRLMLLGSAVRVDDRQFPELHRLLGEVGRTLDCAELPEMYVTANPMLNAMTIGMQRPVIVLNSGLVDLLDESELRFAIAHELGHAMSGHALYQTLLQRLIQLTAVFGAVPLGGLGLRAIVAALYEWSRKAELSADRAGLLATQDPAVVVRVHMQLASGGHLEQLDQASFLEQAREYDESGDVRDSVLKLLAMENASHPFAVSRAAELRRWLDSGEYTRVLAGDYPRRTDDHDASLSDAARDAARSYQQAFERSQDSLASTLRDLGGTAGQMAGSVVGSVRNRVGDALRRGDPGNGPGADPGGE
ncbi:M48 family metallopeptidase [Nocardioides acrostichi]|uniref:M48 family metallopeptidase n=1 Tax=Nocardioides acrostichi TaxID=2784339 RepID=A0A930UUV3_9ACTN|nr:M48 family metallopeptidase [Nocardioides acrostichi]MBF4161278.1 M48 family metallopeptidase [Nocardioides acrostichi]